jgi:MSHA pilin protein MshA
LKAAIQGANTLVYSKAALAGKVKLSDQKLDIAGLTTTSTDTDEIAAAATDDVMTDYGYLDDTEANFTNALDISVESITAPTAGNSATSTGDWGIVVDSGVVSFWQNGAPSTCTFTYTPSTAAGSVPGYGTMPDADKC